MEHTAAAQICRRIIAWLSRKWRTYTGQAATGRIYCRGTAWKKYERYIKSRDTRERNPCSRRLAFASSRFEKCIKVHWNPAAAAAGQFHSRRKYPVVIPNVHTYHAGVSKNATVCRALWAVASPLDITIARTSLRMLPDVRLRDF